MNNEKCPHKVILISVRVNGWRRQLVTNGIVDWTDDDGVREVTPKTGICDACRKRVPAVQEARAARAAAEGRF